MADHSNMSKPTAWVDSEVYNYVMEHFHHGQQTILLRKLFESLKILIEKDEFNQVTNYMYNKTDLTLPGN
ncbi:MAG: hypothetical protein SVO01_00755 [Thermotogota bacterium]|nr:hypothetical protein [Thermotogota bacterium]